jgi:hypothetical protein
MPSVAVFAVNPVIPYAGLVAWMDLLVWALAQTGINPQVSLFTNPITPSPSSVLTDFVAATAAGLGPQPLGSPTNEGVDPYGRDVWTFPVNNFVAAGSGLPVTVYGWFLTVDDPISSNPALLAAQLLPNPFAFFSAGEDLPIPVVLSLAEC